MKSKNLYNQITSFIKSKNYKELSLNPVIDVKYIRNEKLKKYLFTFKDNKTNKTFALRPDLSLMSLIEFSKSKNLKKTKIYYSGESYRKNQKMNTQIGFEIYNYNKQKDEKEIILNSAKIYQKVIGVNGNLKIGNVELFQTVLNQLNLAKRWQDRLISLRQNKKYFNEILKRLETNKDIDENDVELDKKLYIKLKKINPNEIIANRSVKDILRRFEQKIYIQPRPENGKKCVKVIREFLKIKCPIKKAPYVLSKFFKKNKLNILISQDYFPIKINKIGKLNIYFNSSELPEVDIYSGFVFSIRPKSKKIKRSIVGGSYNSLSSSLGLRKINACGAAINL